MSTSEGDLLFGGVDANGAFCSDTWVMTNDWQQLRPARSPSPRHAAPIAHDARSGRVMLHGGYDAQGFLHDTWEWYAGNWVRRDVLPRDQHLSAVYDSARGSALVVGDLGETWHFDGLRWQPAVGGDAPAVHGAALAFDSSRGRAVLFGGSDCIRMDCPGSTCFGTTWEWDGWRWRSRVLPRGPSPRSHAAVAFDQARGVVVLFGGRDGSGVLRDAWQYDGRAWTPIAGGPSARSHATLCYDERRQVCVLYGGYDGGDVLSEVWEWNGVSWRQCRPITMPPPRAAAAMTYDPSRGVVVMSTGVGVFEMRYDSWTWDGAEWQPLVLADRGNLITSLYFDRRLHRVTGVGSTDWQSGEGYMATSLLTSAPPTVKEFGRPCGGDLRLRLLGRPSIGSPTTRFDLSDAGFHAAVAVVVAAQPGRTALPGGCSLALDPGAVFLTEPTVANARGFATAPFAVPERVALRGLLVHAQALAWDAARGFVVSPRVDIGIGD